MLESLACGLITLAGALSAADGVIDGVVFNGTRECAAEGVAVVLRAPVDGEFVVIAETTADADGRFQFRHLPLDAPGPFLPGANLQGVHFPGPRLRLAAGEPRASVTLVVFESAAGPCPLQIERHEMVVRLERGVVRVRETVLINNPSTQCYVGRPRHEGGGPVTLELAIPTDFERVTFDQEAFGRQFRLLNGKLITGLPWPPGQRELGFRYVLASDEAERLWERRVDLPSRNVQLTVEGPGAERMSCNLPPAEPLVAPASEARNGGRHRIGGKGDRGTGEASGAARGGRDEAAAAAAGRVVIFASGEQSLPAGSVIRLQLERLPLPFEAYGRRTAVLVLLGLVAGVTIVTLSRRCEPR